MISNMKKVQVSPIDTTISKTGTPLFTVEHTNIHLGCKKKIAQKRLTKILSYLDKLQTKYRSVDFLTEAYDEIVEKDKYSCIEAYFMEFSFTSSDEELLEKVLIEFMEYCKNTIKVKFVHAEIIRQNNYYCI